MEHLIYQPSERTFRRKVRAIRKALDDGDWSSLKPDDNDDDDYEPADPRYPWLGHRHELSSWYHNPDLEGRQTPDAFPETYGESWDLMKVIGRDAVHHMVPDLRMVHWSLESLDDDEEVVHQIAGFIQSWLLLGVIEIMCNRPISTTVFISKEIVEGKTKEWINTRYLPALLEAWRATLEDSSADSEEIQAIQRRARLNALEASDILNPIHYDADTDDRQGIMLTHLQELLATTVEPVLSSVFEAIIEYTTHFLENDGYLKYWGYRNRNTDHLQRLVGKGWCPFFIIELQESASRAFLRFADVADWAPSSRQHDQCNTSECKASNVDLDTYVQKHVTPRCRCHYLKPDRKRLYEILDAGSIPVVRFAAQKSQLEIDTAPAYIVGANYIAFSHVWADGLGSVGEIGLPRCQVRRLQELVNDIQLPGGWFWIDSLCIPREKYRRQEAIKMMNTTYRNAAATLVLDSCIQMSPASTSFIEVAWRVVASGWMRRMWTFLESHLSARLLLILPNGFIEMTALVDILQHMDNDFNTRLNPFPSILLKGILSSLQKVVPLDPDSQMAPNSHVNISTKFLELYNALSKRQTSRPVGQFLVISIYLGLDIDSLMIHHGEARWIELYKRLRDIPWSILFDTMPKLRTVPFRWAPNTCLYSATGEGGEGGVQLERNPAVCNSQGLRASIIVLKLDRACDTLKVNEDITISVDTDDDHHILYHLNRSPNFEISNILRFNTVIVNYSRNNTPEDVLREKGSIWSAVGVAYRRRNSFGAVEYDFSRAWAIKLVEQQYDLDVEGLPNYTATWEDMDLLFT